MNNINDSEFLTDGQRIQRDYEAGKISDYTDERCETCDRRITQKQLDYSIKKFNKKLCYRCQGFEKYKKQK